MASRLFEPQPTLEKPLVVEICGNTIEIRGATTATPTLTPAAARQTGERLIAAAEQLISAIGEVTGED